MVVVLSVFMFACFSLSLVHLAHSRQRPLSFRNQSIDLLDWYLHDKSLPRDRADASKMIDYSKFSCEETLSYKNDSRDLIAIR